MSRDHACAGAAERCAPFRMTTPRLTLRCWRPDDAAMLVESLRRNLDHLRPWMPWARHERLDVQEKGRWLSRRRRLFERGRQYAWGLFDHDERNLLGAMGLHRRIGSGAGEVGYWVDVGHVGRGLCTEAAAAVVCAAFAGLRLRRVEIHCDSDNLASAAVPRKLGFDLQVTIPGRVHRPDAGPMDTMIWAMGRRAWPSSPAAGWSVQAADASGRPVSLTP